MNVSTAAYVFPAIRGIQAKREFYVIMCPLEIVPRICTFNDKSQPAELRRQRVLNKGRIPSIVRYICDNQDDYVLSALTASADDHIEFIPASNNWPSCNAGTVVVPVTSRFLLNDGQHRRAAIESAISQAPKLAKESIPIVLFWDAGLKRSQQMFADLNTHAVKPSRSLSVLFDHRNPLSTLSHTIVESVDLFRSRIELERSSIPNRSSKLFTLSAIYHATGRLLDLTTAEKAIPTCDASFAVEYWNAISNLIPEWRDLALGGVFAWELRRDFIHSHGVGLQALGRLGYHIRKQHPSDWEEVLLNLEGLDWSRKNAPLWEGRAMIGGRMSNASQNIVLTANLLKKHVGLHLLEDEQKAEAAFTAARKGETNA